MHMIDLRLNPKYLVAHAQALGHNRVHDEDLGYAVHGWLQAALGDRAPHCFRLMEQRNGQVRLLGYTAADMDALREHALSFAPPLATAVCDWDTAASKPMDGIRWKAGQTIGFEVRVCPVVRGKEGERDAFLASLPEKGIRAPKGRDGVYEDWLRSHVGSGIALDDVRLTAFRLVSTWRRAHGKQGNTDSGRRVVRPDALMSGRLKVADLGGFRQLLVRGIGRHRAFGFGMLLLRPA